MSMITRIPVFYAIDGTAIKPSMVTEVWYLKSINDTKWHEVSRDEYLRAENAVGITNDGRTAATGGFSADGICGATGIKITDESGIRVQILA